MKLLIAAMQYDYGDSSRGYSYEWNHFYQGLKNKFSDLSFFDFYAQAKQHGTEIMQQNLQKTVADNGVDTVMISLFGHEFEPQFIKQLSETTKTFGFYMDDGWRKDLVDKYAGCFSAFSTTEPTGPEKYRSQALTSAVYLPFAVNQQLFTASSSKDRDIDVSFVGAWHPYRDWLITKLRKAGINVQAYGYRWPNGPLTTEGMIDIFQRSKISLNLSNSVCYDIRYLLSSPRAVLNTFRSTKRCEQLKGRHFEIPACGAMQLSYPIDGLFDLFQENKEIAVFYGADQLVQKVRYYLTDDRYQVIAEGGHQRCLSEHSYAQRFTDLFTHLGWLNGSTNS